MASSAVALAAAELALAFFGALPTYNAYWQSSLPSFELEREYLYRLQPHASPEFNSGGYRSPEFPAKSARKRLLALGDSFFMGLNVAADQTLPSALARELGERYEVLNLGVYGYGPDQLLARYRAEGAPYQADAVLLGIYAENDFNDLYKNRVFDYAEDGTLTLNARNPVREVLPSTHLELYLRRVFTGHFLRPDQERDLATLLLSDTRDLLPLLPPGEKRAKIFMMRSVLRAFAADFKATGVPLFVVVIPSLANVQEPDILTGLGVAASDRFFNEATAVRLATAAGLPVLDLSGPLAERRSEALYQPQDNHLTAHGNDVAAVLLASWLRSQGL